MRMMVDGYGMMHGQHEAREIQVADRIAVLKNRAATTHTVTEPHAIIDSHTHIHTLQQKHNTAQASH